VRLAILGTRGIPARYGGFETFAEELSTRLAGRGHTVAVYCRGRVDRREYRGVLLQHAPTLRHKYFDTIVHTFFSSLHLLAHRPEVALYCNAANAVFTILPRLAGVPVALNVDGLERHRRKWNALAKAWYLLSERLSTLFPNAVVSDAQHIARYYRERYGKKTWTIRYGAETGRVETMQVVDALGLKPRRYFLYVSRFEPENNPLLVREAFQRVETDMRLALVGDAPYARSYIERVRATSDPRIVIPGAIYGQGYRELQSHCFAYVHATEVGGTHPALIEAMGRGALVLYLDTPENSEVASGVGLPFRHDNLAEVIRDVLGMPEEEREALRQRAVERIRERYDWNSVTTDYESLLLGLIRRGK
jgi:glycosyltransferase involved in cell wall biosynthesis